MSSIFEQALDYMGYVEPVTEVYYGKSKELKKIEELLVPIIDACHRASGLNFDHTRINKMPELKEIESLFKKQFGIKDISIIFYMGSKGTEVALSMIPGAPDILPPSSNAFTYPTSFAYFKKDRANEKLADKRDLVVNVNIDCLFVDRLDLQPDELMGIILHEIGHDFDASYWNYVMDVFLLALNPLNIVIKYIQSNPWVVKNINQNIYKSTLWLSENIPPFKIVNNLINKAISNIEPLLNIASIATIPSRLIRAAILPISLRGYASEKFADSFASAYGYGPGLSTALNKMQNNEDSSISKSLQKTKILNIGPDLVNTILRTLTFALDEHPDNALRVNNQLKKLKRDLSDPNLPPEVKKDLMNQINQLENFIDTVMTSKENAKEKGLYFTTIFNKIAIKTFNGKIDPRELIELISKIEL